MKKNLKRQVISCAVVASVHKELSEALKEKGIPFSAWLQQCEKMALITKQFSYHDLDFKFAKEDLIERLEAMKKEYEAKPSLKSRANLAVINERLKEVKLLVV